jgi:hypothetical protein
LENETFGRYFSGSRHIEMVIMANFYEQVTNILCVYTEKIPEIYVSGLYF